MALFDGGKEHSLSPAKSIKETILSESNMSSITYERLDHSTSEIRLLRFLHSSDGQVRCHLIKHSLENGPELRYSALSYVWGDPNVTKDILVNGKPFAATTNLVAALEVLSNVPKASSYVWIDAICINQADMSERNHQVQKMVSIYKNAVKVLAWLGPEQNHSTEVIAIMKHIVKEIELSPDAGVVEVFEKPAPDHLLKARGLETSGETLLSFALPRKEDIPHLLSQRDFWKRIWILQELVLARRVTFMCGYATFWETDITQIGNWLATHPTRTIPSGIEWAKWLDFEVGFNNAFRVPMQSLTLAVGIQNVFEAKKPDAWTLFESALRLRATDPRDQVYSLLGLAEIGIEADYSKSTEAVYLELAAVMLERAPLDGWFRYTGILIKNSMATLPSWVVDWDTLSREGSWGRHPKGGRSQV